MVGNIKDFRDIQSPIPDIDLNQTWCEHNTDLKKQKQSRSSDHI